MNARKSKLRSRKFWLTLIATVMPTLIQLVTNGVGWDRVVFVSVAATVAYVVTEGFIDAKGVRRGAQ